LADAGNIGYMEVDPDVMERRRVEALESMQKHVTELLKDDRIKPTVSLSVGGAPESHEARRSLHLRGEHSEPLLTSELPAVTQEARKAIRTVEIIASERHALEDRGEQKEVKNQEFIRKHVYQPVPPEVGPPPQMRSEEQRPEADQLEREKNLAVTAAQETARVIAELKSEREQRRKDQESRKPKPKDNPGRALHSSMEKKKRPQGK
jgi:hypothetical protein